MAKLYALHTTALSALIVLGLAAKVEVQVSAPLVLGASQCDHVTLKG